MLFKNNLSLELQLQLQNKPIINYINDNLNNIQNNRIIKKIYNYYFHPSGVHYLVL